MYFGPWHTCRNGKCKCGGVWTRDFPVAEVTRGDWGDEYPAIRHIEGDGMAGTAVEAYMEKMVYGHIEDWFAEAAAKLIAAAPDMYATLERAAFEIRCGLAGPDTISRIENVLDEARNGIERDRKVLDHALAQLGKKPQALVSDTNT